MASQTVTDIGATATPPDVANHPQVASFDPTTTETSSAGIATLRGNDHRVVYLNDAFSWFVRPLAEVLPDAHAAWWQLIEAASRLRRPQTDVQRGWRAPDGSVRDLRISAWPSDDDNDAVTFVIEDITGPGPEGRRAPSESELLVAMNERLVATSVREIAHARHAEQTLRQLNALLDGVADGVVIAKGDGRLLVLSRAARRMFGFQDDGPRTVRDLERADFRGLDGAPLPPGACPFRRALQGERFSDFEFIVVVDGNERRVLTSGHFVDDERGRHALAIVLARDVTELRRLEQLRDEYTALISHDLRGPLSALISWNGVLKRMVLAQSPAADALRAIERIERSAAQMDWMVSELTQAAKMEAPAADGSRAPLDIVKLTSDTIECLEESSRARIIFDGETPCMVHGDAEQLTRALGNLISNALKYSPPDSPIDVGVSVAEHEATVSVHDRGIGIRADEVPHVFERYFRTKAGRHASAGLGLGLYITRLIVEAHGGHVAVESTVGRGSTFHLALPAA